VLPLKGARHIEHSLSAMKVRTFKFLRRYEFHRDRGIKRQTNSYTKVVVVTFHERRQEFLDMSLDIVANLFVVSVGEFKAQVFHVLWVKVVFVFEKQPTIFVALDETLHLSSFSRGFFLYVQYGRDPKLLDTEYW
jgi:hypothetical protein